MRIVCINSGSYHLTKGRIYDVIEEVDVYSNDGVLLFNYSIKNDIGVTHCAEKELFIPLSEVRDKKLTQIGI